jgi:hypothetical protein
VMLAVSLSWIALYIFTPAGSRPYIDASTDNSPFAMVFGYNGLQRFAISVPGVIPPGVIVPLVRGNWNLAGEAYQLFGGGLGPQFAWLLPLALLALVAGLVACGRASRADPVRAGFVMWGIWLVTFDVVFSKMGAVLHTAYVAAFAPPVAALSGVGIVMFLRWYRAGDWRGLLLPLTVVAELAWASHLWSLYPTFLPWARWAVTAAGAAAAVALAVGWQSQRPSRTRGTPGQAAANARLRGRLVAAALIAGVAVMLAAPVTWALSVLDPVYAGGSFNAIAGPTAGGNPYHITATLTGPQRRIYAYAMAHRNGASYLLATQSWSHASPYILATGQEALPMGGFSGFAPEPTLAHIQQLVSSGQLRFFEIVVGVYGISGPPAYKIGSWVKQACNMIPAKDYGGTPASGLALYQCGTGG